MMLDPQFVARLRTRDPASGEVLPDDVLEQLERAMANGKAAADAIGAVATALAADTTQTAGSRALKIRQVALAQGERAARTLDTARQRAVESIAELERELTPEPDEASERFASTILARLAAMKDEQRASIMAAAIDADDQTVLATVFAAPSWLSGHGEAELAMRIDAWRRRHRPKEHDRLARIRQAADAVERGGASLVAYVRHVADEPAAMLAEAAAKRSADAIAVASTTEVE
jgi:hypothetical protein